MSFFSLPRASKIIFCVFTCLFVTFASIGNTAAQVSEPFPTPGVIRKRVEFWKLVFTKYDSNHLVFHNRAHPEIIYSVLDFSDYAQVYSGRTFARKKNQAIKEEIAKIRKALRRLGRGKSASNELEIRIDELFKEHIGSKRARHRAYKKAQEIKQVRYQTGIRERFSDGIRRSNRYLYAIEEVFGAAGLPLELARLPLVESSFDYKAYSSVGAAGIWQFTRTTGKQYLSVGPYLDERRDPILASRAAAKYLRHSYKKLGSWPLAITSYNHGLSGIMRASKQTGSRDLSVIVQKYKSRSFGFASSNFYAEFIAALEVERNWRSYFPELSQDNPIHFDEVRLSAPISFRKLVKSSSSNEDEVRNLNPALLRSIIQGRVNIPKNHVVKVPKGRGNSLVASLGRGDLLSVVHGTNEYLSGTRRSVQFDNSTIAGSKYKVRQGDTLGSIARRFSVKQSALARLNGIKNPRRLRAGKVLRIPGKSIAKSRRSPSSKVSTGSKYKVKRGDTLGSIAKQFSVKQTMLAKANGIKDPRKLIAGAVLKIPGQGNTARSNNSSKTYTVKKGDNMTKIAKKLGVSLAALKKFNPTIKSNIFPGQRLAVP